MCTRKMDFRVQRAMYQQNSINFLTFPAISICGRLLCSCPYKCWFVLSWYEIMMYVLAEAISNPMISRPWPCGSVWPMCVHAKTPGAYAMHKSYQLIGWQRGRKQGHSEVTPHDQRVVGLLSTKVTLSKGWTNMDYCCIFCLCKKWIRQILKLCK